MNVVENTNLKRVLNTKYLNRDATTDITEDDLSNLKGVIYVVNEKVESLKEIQFATNISGLNINLNAVMDISQIKSLSKLTKLLANHNQIMDVSVLSSLMLLDELDLSTNQISDVSSLNTLNRVVSLDLSHNQIADCSVIENLLKQTIENKTYARLGAIHLGNQTIEHTPIYTVKGKDVEINWTTFGIFDRHRGAPKVDHIAGENVSYNEDTQSIIVKNVQEERHISIQFSTTDDEIDTPFSGIVSVSINLIPTVSYVSKRLT